MTVRQPPIEKPAHLSPVQRFARTVAWLAMLMVLIGGLGASFLLYFTGWPIIGSVVLVVTLLAGLAYLHPRLYAYRYLFPGLLGFGVFVIFPLIYTIYIGFTNYGGRNLLVYDDARRYLQQETYLASEEIYRFDVHRVSSDRYVIALEREGTTLVTEPVDLEGGQQTVSATAGDAPAGESLPLRDVIALRAGLDELAVQLQDGTLLRRQGLRQFAARRAVWTAGEGDELVDARNGRTIRPDHARGFFVDDTGQTVGPGFRTFVGVDNFQRLFTTPGLRTPLLRIFLWNIAFALLSVLFTASLGTILATVLQWPALRLRSVYRTLLILPYAVPAFISILIFRGLFNPNFGEINLLLNAMLGSADSPFRPAWFADPWLARAMILLVNTWLGYPYMMIVATGILQTVPDSIHEAAAIDGAGPFRKSFSLILPAILPAMMPLLVASFAFNFNNFVLIFLLTGGGPDLVGAQTVAGETDLLVSYTFRLAFRDSAANYGYASAIASLIFIIVAVLAWINLRLTRTRVA